jgi:signal transduction histidine kinase
MSKSPKPNNLMNDFHSVDGLKLNYRQVTSKELDELYEITEIILKEKKEIEYKSFLQTVLKELIQNAVKATQKRIYFKKFGFDIKKTTVADVDKFKESITNGTIHALMEEDSIDFAAEVCFRDDKDSFKITVRNHGEMNSLERKNVEFMFTRGRDVEDVSDLLTEETGNKEGGGLGLSMILILMRKLNIPSENLYFRTNDLYTIFTIIIPYKI